MRSIRHPRHPYTHELLRAMPSTDPQVQPQRLAQRARRGAALAAAAAERLRLPHALPALALPLCAERIPPWEEIRAGHLWPATAGGSCRPPDARRSSRPRGRYCPRQLLFFGS